MLQLPRPQVMRDQPLLARVTMCGLAGIRECYLVLSRPTALWHPQMLQLLQDW